MVIPLRLCSPSGETHQTHKTQYNHEKHKTHITKKHGSRTRHLVMHQLNMFQN
jgi:hypothetical protein